MNILHVQKIKGIGGSERYFLELIPRLKEQGIDGRLLIFYIEKDKHKLIDYFQKLEKSNIKFYTTRIRSDKSFFTVFKSIKSAIKDYEPSIINSHLIHADLWLSLYKRLHKLSAPIVSTKHGFDENYMNQFGLDFEAENSTKYIKIARFAEKRITSGFCVSAGLSNLYFESKITPVKYQTIHHAFETKSPLLSSSPKKAYDLVILGRYVPLKNHNFLIRSIKIYEEKYEKTLRLNIVGLFSEIEKKTIQSLCSKLDIRSTIAFTGHVENVIPYITQAHCLICPSKAEGFGLVVLEGMSLGVKVIINNVQALNEIVSTEEGWVFKANNELDCAIEINTALTDDSKRKEANALKRLKSHFSYQRMLTEVSSFYQQLL